MIHHNYQLSLLSTADAEHYFEFIDKNRERISRYFPRTIAATGSLESTLQHIKERVKAAENLEIITHLVKERESGKIIATIFMKDIDKVIGKAELGFFIDENHQRKGITSKFVAEVCAYGFEELGLSKLFMRIAETNTGSIRVAEKNGFVKEGILRKDFRTTDGALIDVAYFSKIKDGIK